MFKKSSLSYRDDPRCVEVELKEDGVRVRNSRLPECILEFTTDEWGAFVLGVKNGEFELKR